MHKNYFTLAALAQYFSARVAGSRFLEAYSHQPGELILSFLPQQSGATPVNLRVVSHLQRGCVFISPYGSPPKRNVAYFFNTEQGGAVRDVSISPGDRIITIQFDSSPRRSIRIIMYGKRGGNVALVNAEQVIEESWTNPKQLLGTIYRDDAPPWREIIRNDAIRNFAGDSAQTKNWGAILAGAYPFLGPVLSAEVLFRADVLPNETPRTDLDEMLPLIAAKTLEVIDECSNAIAPAVITVKGKRIFALIRLRHLEGCVRIECADVNDGVRRWYGETAKQESSGIAYATAEKNLVNALERIERAIEKTKEEIARDTGAHFRIAGEALMAHAHEIETGAASATIEGVAIALDAKLSAIQNAVRYFERAKKKQEAVKRSMQRLHVLETRRTKLADAIQKFRSSATDEEKQTLIKENAKYMTQSQNDESAHTPEHHFRYFLLTEGCEVYAGKNAAQNDELTLHFAKQNDLWFHARGAEGSHVILRWTKKGAPTKEYILRAAAIAAFYSSAKNSTYTPVAYTQRKYVHKPRGAKPGSVSITREEVVMVKPAVPANPDELEE